jgi:hypothetical protein
VAEQDPIHASGEESQPIAPESGSEEAGRPEQGKEVPGYNHEGYAEADVVYPFPGQE